MTRYFFRRFALDTLFDVQLVVGRKILDLVQDLRLYLDL